MRCKEISSEAISGTCAPLATACKTRVLNKPKDLRPNPVEMGLPDSACLAYRLSKAAYRKQFEAVWGADSFCHSMAKRCRKRLLYTWPPSR